MSTTLGLPRDEETIAIRAVNSLFLSGLVLDLMAAFLAFLTSRWLQRLSAAEQGYLEDTFQRRQEIIQGKGQLVVERAPVALLNRSIYTFFAMSLFVPMPLLIIGVVCMVAGLLTYAWSQHATIVATLVTTTCVLTLPFLAGIFLIGRKEGRRKAVIERLSAMQGDW